MQHLLDSVGEQGKNHRDDVTLVQTLLKSRGFDPGRIDGLCGNKTISAIQKFQSSFMPHPDGLIQPGLTTWLKLSGGGDGHTAHASAEWSGDSAKWPQDKKIRSMHYLLQPKVSAVRDGLRKKGFQPQVFYGWRSVAVQLQLFSQGKTKVEFSFHNAQKPNCTPNSYAADIIDSRYGWSDQAGTSGFWKGLGEETKKVGLVWGGDWKDFPDPAHIQLVPNSQLHQIKMESGL